jgi:hypothetical protein
MGVEQNSTVEVPQKVRSWINCLPGILSRSLMEGTDDDNSRRHRCGGLLCECCGLDGNGFEKEGGEKNSSFLSLKRMDESTGPVQSGSEGAKIEHFMNELFSNRTLHYSFPSPR